MKKLFKNEDGTLKVINIIIFVDIIVAVILLSMVKSIYGNLSNTAGIIRTTTASKTTTTIDMCNGCSIVFRNSKMTAQPKSSYVLEELLNVQKVSMNYVEYEISDENLAKLTSKNGKKILEILDTVGKFTITANYYSNKTTMEVTISSDKIMDIEFDQDIYYVKVGDKLELKYDIIPKGLKDLEVSKRIDDIEIASFDVDNNIVGKKVGKTSLKVQAGDFTKNIPIYVVNSNITLKIKEGFLYRDLKNATYNGKDIEILLALENTNYSNEDITYEVISDDMSVEIEYVKKNADNLNAYEYILKISNKEDPKKLPTKGATIIFTIPDGSKHELKIELETNE